MDNRGKRQAASIFGGMGFYIALLVCVVAAGVVGYFALLNDETETVNDPLQMVDQLTPGPSQAVVEPDPEPARPVISDQPVTVIRQEPPEETEPEPDPAPEAPVSAPVQEPVMAQEPMAVVPPLAGETAAVFSIDQLTYDATLGDWRTHDGIDIRAAAGDAVVAAAAGTVRSWGLEPKAWRKKLTAKHIFTHVEWRMTGYTLEVAGAGPPGLTWADSLEPYAVPSAFARFREEAEGERIGDKHGILEKE